MPLNLFGKTFQWSFVIMIAVELLALATFFSPPWSAFVFWFVLVVVAVVAFWRIDYAFLIVFGELFLGAKGQLLSIHISGFDFSIRLALFILVFGIWLFRSRRQPVLKIQSAPTFLWLMALLGVILVGAVNGLLRGNNLENIFFDVNGYLFLALIFPVVEIFSVKEKVEQLLQVLFAAICFLALQTLLLLALFSHQLSVLPELYRWVRDARLFEITGLAKNFFRVFSQAHFFSMIGIFLGLSFLLLDALQDRRALKIVLFLVGSTLLISFSRSFWLALLVVLVVFLPLRLRHFQWPWPRILRLGLQVSLVVVLEVLLISFIANFPYLWNRPGGSTALALLQERSTDLTEAAAQSRYTLLGPLTKASLYHPFLGTGFGTTVTFETRDPRLVAAGSMARTTYAFEWGYLDFWLKLGLLGVAAITGLLVSLWRWANRLLRNARNPSEKALLVGLQCSLLALIVTHGTSPYLNHPLGLGFVMLMTVLLVMVESGAHHLEKSS